VQGFDPQDQGLDQDQYAPYEWDPPELSIKDGVQRLKGMADLAVLTAHRKAEVVPAPDHHSFNNGLPAVSESRLFGHLLPFSRT
jgi:hypothetical protein